MTDPDDAESRVTQARERDQNADQRDREAELRDWLADAADAQIAELQQSAGNGNGSLDGNGGPDGNGSPGGNGGPVGNGAAARLVRDRERAEVDRASAAAQRAAAARDREDAARDRALAAADREHAAALLAAAGVDDLTGALRRGVGLTSLAREVARAHRTGDPLVVAFIDVDEMKRVNDTHGHTAGDDLLRRVVGQIKTQLRPYDIMVRVGGDEFVCSLYGATETAVSQRLAQVHAGLAAARGGGSISVGLAELKPGESLDEVIGRADAALLAGRGAKAFASRRFRRNRR